MEPWSRRFQGGGEHRQEMLSEDGGEFLPAAADVFPFQLEIGGRAELLFLPGYFMVLVVPAVLMPGKQVVLVMNLPADVFPPGPVEPSGDDGGAQGCFMAGKEIEQQVLPPGGDGHIIRPEKYRGGGMPVEDCGNPLVYIGGQVEPEGGHLAGNYHAGFSLPVRRNIMAALSRSPWSRRLSVGRVPVDRAFCIRPASFAGVRSAASRMDR